MELLRKGLILQQTVLIVKHGKVNCSQLAASLS